VAILRGKHYKGYITKDINSLFDLIYDLHSITLARDPHLPISRFIFDFSTQGLADQTTSTQLYLVRIITENRVIYVIHNFIYQDINNLLHTRFFPFRVVTYHVIAGWNIRYRPELITKILSVFYILNYIFQS